MSAAGTGIEAQLRLARRGFRLEVAFSAPARGVTALFGPSGCGKSSTLRCLAGLEPAARGRLWVNGEPWQDETRFLPAHRRPIGYVPQEVGLFPHLSVEGNLRYGLRRVPAASRRVAFDEAVALLGVGPLLSRRIATLSGGERQRIGIARALLTSPRLLLMDEPLAALDAGAKAEILPYLERLHRELDIPVIYVSHAPDEVARLADHVVVLEAGRVRAAGALAELLVRPGLPLGGLEDAAAVLEAVVLDHDPAAGLTTLTFPGGRLRLPLIAQPLGTRLRLRVQARDVALARGPAEEVGILNRLPVRIEALEAAGPGELLAWLRAGESRLLARLTRHAAGRLGLAPGAPAYALIKAAAVLA